MQDIYNQLTVKNSFSLFLLFFLRKSTPNDNKHGRDGRHKSPLLSMATPLWDAQQEYAEISEKKIRNVLNVA